MPKFREYFREMIDTHEEEFKEFADVHALYAQDKKKWQDEFNQKGEVVNEIIRTWESRLCGKSERGNNAVFSSRLAEKFRGEVKAFFPLIDFVGVKIK